MLKTIRMISACVLVAAITFIPHASMYSVYAQDNVKITNNCTYMTEKQTENIFQAVKENMNAGYGDVFTFDNYEVLFGDERVNDDYISVNIEVVADMTDIRHPEENPFMRGMAAAIEEITDSDKKAVAVRKYEEHLQKQMTCYQKPIETGFLYQVHLPLANSSGRSVENEYELFHMVDAEDGDILTPAGPDEIFQELYTEADGRNYVEEMYKEGLTKDDIMQTRAVSYNKSAAVRYAKNHATDEPEYSTANGMGSDCANFVSKCLNAGGIPEDRAGGWYRAPRAGAYGGDNWIRTGYYNNGGVVPYMLNKDYFKAVSKSNATLGSIIGWNDKSHVAIVTSLENNIIKYSHHSNVKKTSVYYTFSNSDNATFYAPKI
ncbi:MAG: amidase domain-containing protein [Eubacterium sp.]|nr:amidase domain-containing protein [Eubacterium sp.]